MAKTGTVNTKVNYDDKRFQQVENDKQSALNEVDKTYGDMIGASDSYYQSQIDASKQWADTQTKLQNEQTDFAIEKIEQQKEQAQKDYTKEQSGAYVDWQKQSNQYGVKAEQMASSGMTSTGYSESSQVAMYNTYQMRVATARESFNNAILNYNNSIKDARLQNNSALAEIAYNALQQQLELSLQGFQYKNQLILDKANKKTEVENNYYNRYQDVLSQINHENSLAEQIRQYNEQQAFKEKQFAEEQRQYNQNYALQQAQLAEEKRQFNEQLALSKSKSSSSGGSSGSSKKSSSKKSSSSSKKSSSSGSSSIKKSSSSGSSKVNKKSSGASVDTKSVLNLGYGPISGDKLADLVSKGQVTAKQSGNKISVQKTATAPAKLNSKKTITSKRNWMLTGLR